MKYQAAIIKSRRNVKQPHKSVFTLVLLFETNVLADVAIKLDEIQQKAEDCGDDSVYKVFFAVN